MIEIENLKKRFGSTVAVDVEKFAVESGEIVGLVGNNGAGKTTLFRLILDLLLADEGNIVLSFNHDKDGQPLTQSLSVNPAKSDKWKMLTGAYLDDGFLIDFLTPEEYFDFIAQVNGIADWRPTIGATDSANKEELPMLIDELMHGEILDQHKLIRDFSAGNKQKIGIIAALMARPQLLILDEPFNFLDPSGQIALKRIVKAYNHQSGATILISSHNLTHTIDICQRIALMENGRIIKDLANSNGEAMKPLEEYFE